METFEGIHLDLSKQSGRCRIAEAGVGWKPKGEGDLFTIDKDQILQAQWSRAARGYELKLITKAHAVNQLDGFQSDDLEKLTTAFRRWYNVNVEQKEHALRGWNWGKTEFTRTELIFNVQNRPAFEIPYTEVSNTNLAGRNEVAVDFALADGDGDTGTNGHLGGARGKGKKSGGARDELVEARFYIPGAVVKRPKKEGGEDGEVASDDEGAEEQNAANVWYDTLMDKAEIGDVAGDTIASFMDLLHLTPRGRFDLDMYESSFRLRGKTYDYKIQYGNIKKVFVLPKPDEIHTLMVIGLEPALRQGQTRYPFVVMQLKRDDDIDIDINISEEELKSKYSGKLEAHYSGPIHNVLASLLRGLAGKRITVPAKDFQSRHAQHGIKCSIKANEGHLFMLEKAFIFTPKPCTYIQTDQIASVTLSRIGGPGAAARTFDMTFHMKGGASHQFSNVSREEQQPVEDFLELKNLKVRNEMAENESLIAAALQDQSESDEEVVGADRGSADEDSEEEDEDFKAESESDVADEFDSNVEDSDSGSDAEMGDGDDDDDAGSESDTEAKVERPKKKSKA